jgi:FkbM family methyltransferase
MKNITFFKAQGIHDSFPERFSAVELAEHGVYSASEEDADFIVGAILEDLVPFITKHRSSKLYCIWCDEPLWSNVFTILEKPQYFYKDGQFYDYWVPDSASILVMNCFTADVYFTNHHFLSSSYYLDINCLKNISKRKMFSAGLPKSERKIAAIHSYRNAGKWNFKSDSYGIRSICNLRSCVALEGSIFGHVDIYGSNWPIKGISKEDSRWVDDPWKIKMQHLKNYFFALCFENCIAPNYVTEKIWHAIAAGVLPIYYAGASHTIYRDFPKGSFIDFADFHDPISCWEFVDSISTEEYDRRLKLCIDVLESCINRSHEGSVPKQYQLLALTSRLKACLTTNKNTPVSKTFSNIDWQALLGKDSPVILDIGANDGGTTAAFISRMPKSRIFSFEPDPRPILRFKDKLAGSLRNASVELFEGVLSDSEGHITFYQSEGSNPEVNWYEGGWDLSGSIKKPKEHTKLMPTITFSNSIKVPTTTLDQWILGKDIDVVDLAWIDVQGAELNVIMGARKTLSRIRYMHVEYSEHEMYEGQMDIPELIALLPDFEVMQVYSGDVLLKNKLL